MVEWMIQLSVESRVPIYQQIYEFIKQEIVDGKISVGERLPSTRLLSKSLQVSRSTVELSYQQLMEEGYIESEPCKGYYVCDISVLYGKHWEERQSQPKQEICPENTKRKIVIDCSPDRIDTERFPVSIWKKISKEVQLQTPESFLVNGDSKGEYALREEIRKYLQIARGVRCMTQQIIIGAGNEYLLMLLAQILGENQVVAMENPTYLQAYHTFLNMKYEVVPIETDQSGMKMNAIRMQTPNLLYTMPSHQFPLGTVMPLKRRMELLMWAKEKDGRYIIEDDHDSEFRLKGKPIPALQGMDPKGDSVIYIGTFSKSISSALRVSYMILPFKLLRKYEETCAFYSTTVPREQQLRLAKFLGEGYFERHLNRMRGVYRIKHDLLLGLLKKQEWVSNITGDHAGLHFIVEMKDTIAITAGQLCEQLQQEGILIYPLEQYFYPCDGICRTQYDENRRQRMFLFGYGGLNEEEIRSSMDCMAKKVQGIEDDKGW